MADASSVLAGSSGNGTPSQPAASTSKLQYAYRAEKSVGMVAGAPVWSHMESYTKPEGQQPLRAAIYSPDGGLYAVAGSDSTLIYDVKNPDNVQLVKVLPVKNALEIDFSPQGTYLSTWIRPIKLDDGAQHKNLQIWSTATAANGEEEIREVASFTQKLQEGWKLQFTEDESCALRGIQNEIHILDPAKDFTMIDKLRIENIANFSLSPGKNPSVAVFVPEKKGMPGSVSVHSLATLSVPSIRKSFYKADRGQIKWNSSGTSLLFLSSTDHDKTGKSYYGETNLYLMTPALQYEARLVLDKEGGIGDFAWNPANGGKEFAVSYGWMPAKTTLFDLRLNVLHEFGALPRNFVSFNPQGRLLCIAGFGNLAGQIDIWDRSTLKKVANFQVNNCTECTWSPDGRLLMCSTLSPRLRVDNGIRIHHWSGDLIHLETVNELYQAAWRPVPASEFAFPRSLSPAPAASRDAQLFQLRRISSSGNGTDSGTASPKPVVAGAYRPPGLRNREIPTIFKREDEGGLPYTPSKSNGSDKPGIPGLSANAGAGRGRGKTVPGAAPRADGPDGGQKKGQHGKKGKQQQHNTGQTREKLADDVAAISVQDSAPATPAKSHLSNSLAQDQSAASQLTPEDKKRRALQKKLGAIEALKARRAAGEKLEKTQEKKIEAEDEVKKELAELAG